ncbi:MAG: hypothetical protein WCL32_17805 [Planctomycetota bacterium]
MKFSFRSLKAFVAAAVMIAVPCFAAYALTVNTSPASSVSVAAEHDPLLHISNVVEAPYWIADGSKTVPTQAASEKVTADRWFTAFIPKEKR